MSIPALSPASSLAADPRPLPLFAKLLYGIGDMPITVLMVLSGLFILFFYNSVMGLPASLVGIGVSASLVLDAILDPYIGHISDRTRHRFGRRHAFMLPGALAHRTLVLFVVQPAAQPGPHRAVPVAAGLFDRRARWRAPSTAFPYLSLGAEMSRDYDDRTSTMAIRTLFGLAGTLAGGGLSFLLFFPATADGSEPKLHYAGTRIWGWLSARSCPSPA